MSTFKNKKQVVAAFGSPTKIDTIQEIEVWYYHIASATDSYTRGSGNADTRYSSTYSGIRANTNANISARTHSSSYDKYTEFQFDGELVVSYRSQGVNYGEKFSPFKVFKSFLWGSLIDLALVVGLASAFGG